MSLESGIFPDKLNIARVIPLFKAGDPANISNYRPISVLPFFSKMLERIMYVCINIWQQKKIYTLNRLVFKEAIQLGVFIDLSEAFDTINHSVLIKKLQMYGIKGINLAWFHNYLENRKQYISLGHDLKTGNQNIFCGVPEGSILRPLFFCYMFTIFPIP